MLAILLVSLLISACSSGQPAGSQYEVPFVDSALRFELSFGDEGLPEEFLLADPKGLAVKGNCDILVADEHHLKIFDADGVPKERLGGEGQGPGEFQESQDILLSPTGFFAVGNSFSQFNLYSPDNEFLTKYNGSADPLLREYCLEEGLTFSYVMQLSMLDAEMNGEEIADGIYSRFEPYAVDIVSVSSGRLVARAEFPCIPDVIKDGRAYRLIKRADAFPKVECFRIDPAVYRSGRDPL